MPDLILTVNGTEYGGWMRANVHRGIEEIAGKFLIEVTELWPDNATPRQIHTGDACSLAVNGKTVITGSVDKVKVTYDNSSHNVSIEGRDATCDLVDCSAIYKTGQWTNAKLDQIARDLCAPFKIKVLVQTDIGAVFPKWKIQEGETCYECLERAARLRGVLLLSDGQGGLILGKPGTASIGVTLERGVNILKAEGENDQSKRFSQYTVKGQRAGTDHDSGEPLVAQKGMATDADVKRYRPLVIVCEDQGQIADFNLRAKLEATVRAARALQAKIGVQGWSVPSGDIWSPNKLVTVRDPWLGIDRDLLIKEVDLTLDEQGTRAEISLTIAEAYDVLPPKHVKKDKKGKKGKKPDATDAFFGSDG